MNWICGWCSQRNEMHLRECGCCGKGRSPSVNCEVVQRVCKSCKAVKSLNDFYLLKRKYKTKTYENRQTLCKKCHNQRSNLRMKERMGDPEFAKRYNEYHRKYQANYERRKKFGKAADHNVFELPGETLAAAAPFKEIE